MLQVQQNVTAALSGIEQEIAYAYGFPLRGLNLHRTEGGWLLVIKTQSVQRGALVAFFGGRSIEDCVAAMFDQLNTKQGITWKPDRFAGEK
jgi:hypothetical protein